ncbi:M48 family metallopeptidase [Ammoniphilus oxalaticus]|uniref:M48 family metallopeptidase n=1 Tax=Ammoniphilus oxalaticus TaxID=66863 RepID=UPI0014744614|nr:M48 family metallopeptidase [Ammoniphilus oxalaticus]
MRKFYIFFTAALIVYIAVITVYLINAPSSLPLEWQGSAADPATFMTEEQLQQSVSFSREKNIITFISGPIKWAIYLLILGIGLSAAYARGIKRIFKWNIVNIFLFLLLLTLTTTILQFPLDYYLFQLRHEYGISTQPFSNWIFDRMKSFGISLVMMTPIVWLFYFILRKSPKRWWLWLWGCSIPLILFSMYAKPVILDPIFNEFSPLQDQQLKHDILQLAEQAQVPTHQVYEVDMSKKTNALNAYVTGVGSNTRIVLWDTTLQKLKKDEVLFIMAHEIGHYALHHMTWLFFGTIFAQLVALYLLSLTFRWTVDRFGPFWGIQHPQELASLPIILLLFSVFSFVSMPIQNGVSRHYEQAADVYAMDMLEDHDAAVRTFQRLAVEGLSEVNPPRLVKYVLYTHPTLYERILFAQQFQRSK